MKKISKMGELAWLLGTILCGFGVVLCTKANFGLSMFAAPPYILHVVLVKLFPWYTQGTSEYIWQLLLLAVLCLLVMRFRLKYLMAYAVAILFGLVIDGWIFVFGGSEPFSTIPGRICAFALGELTISASVAMVFRSYMPPQIPECLVMEVAQRYGKSMAGVKQITDLTCLALSFVLSLVLTGGFTGVGIGTVIFTLCNASLIRLWGKVLDRYFTFEPAFPKWKSWLDKC